MADGLKTALALLEGQAEPLDRSEQLAFPGGDYEAEADLPLVDSSVRRASPKGGRPAGRMNRSTQDWVRFISARYRSPLVGLAEIWSRPVAELAKELGLYRYGSDGKPLADEAGNPHLNLIEAFKLQQSAMLGALPYLHSKMPQAVQIDQKTRGLLVIGDLGSDAESDVLTLNLYEENQSLDDTQAQQSDDGKVG